ncbi:TetR/AcrR family transcriptional regulator [Gordonia sp. TBRC 11910]|uniref:TetR/AcrR family transcriptional regulator n=1 Tax=Gordonia asplenii TaxID=2725283 RepID=A0A848L400_9ACTN|nr:TetR/AcrR family transcriptional regulator [Gordonia asplenii]NMO05277.1 TetR/AcrR family transcriptional regulator [Gordonia asplenii]
MEEIETKATRTRRRILAAAAHEFAQHGYGGASLRRIADAADLKVGSLGFHFATKDELVAATLRDGVDSAREALSSAVDAVPADADPTDRLYAAVRGHLRALHASDDRASSVVRMVDTLPADLRADHVAHERRFARVWLDVLTRGQREDVVRDDVDIRVLRDLVVGALNSTSTTNPQANRDLDAVVETVVRVVAP